MLPPLEFEFESESLVSLEDGDDECEVDSVLDSESVDDDDVVVGDDEDVDDDCVFVDTLLVIVL